jgi:hypothetical protein
MADRYGPIRARERVLVARARMVCLIWFVAIAVSAIIAVAGTLLGSTLTYLFQLRASERAEISAFQRELRAERRGAYGAYSGALAEWRRGQIDWYNRQAEDPDSEMTLAARVESYRLKGVAHTALSQVQLVASDQELVITANRAFELTRPVHYAQDGADLDRRSNLATEAVDNFIALAAAEVQSAAAVGLHHREYRST